MNKIIPYGKHFIDDDDIKAVVDVLRHKNLTQGAEVESFEHAVADFVGAKYAVAMSSWTAGLHMACLAAGVSKGDKVVTSPITFVASANAAIYCNAKPSPKNHVFEANTDLNGGLATWWFLDDFLLFCRLGPQSGGGCRPPHPLAFIVGGSAPHTLRKVVFRPPWDPNGARLGPKCLNPKWASGCLKHSK